MGWTVVKDLPWWDVAILTISPSGIVHDYMILSQGLGRSWPWYRMTPKSTVRWNNWSMMMEEWEILTAPKTSTKGILTTLITEWCQVPKAKKQKPAPNMHMHWLHLCKLSTHLLEPMDKLTEGVWEQANRVRVSKGAREGKIDGDDEKGRGKRTNMLMLMLTWHYYYYYPSSISNCHGISKCNTTLFIFHLHTFHIPSLQVHAFPLSKKGTWEREAKGLIMNSLHCIM